jgi:hypothetical protein
VVNVNVCYTAFYKQQNLADAMEEFEGASFGGLVDKYVEGIRVQPTHVRPLVLFGGCMFLIQHILLILDS